MVVVWKERKEQKVLHLLRLLLLLLLVLCCEGGGSRGLRLPLVALHAPHLLRWHLLLLLRLLCGCTEQWLSPWCHWWPRQPRRLLQLLVLRLVRLLTRRGQVLRLLLLRLLLWTGWLRCEVHLLLLAGVHGVAASCHRPVPTAISHM